MPIKRLPSVIGFETPFGGMMFIVGVWGVVATWDTLGVPLMMVAAILGFTTMMGPVARHYDAKKVMEVEMAKQAREEKLWEMYWQ